MNAVCGIEFLSPRGISLVIVYNQLFLLQCINTCFFLTMSRSLLSMRGCSISEVSISFELLIVLFCVLCTQEHPRYWLEFASEDYIST